jgi:hypothetical protein
VIGLLARLLPIPRSRVREIVLAAYEAGEAIGAARERLAWLDGVEDPDIVEAGATAALDQVAAANEALGRLAD